MADLDTALEHHLHDVYRGAMSIPSIPKLHHAFCLFNFGELDRQLNLADGPMSVARITEEFGVQSFLPQFDDFENAKVSKGEIVVYEGQACRVLGRREVTALAAMRTDEFEIFVETLDLATAGFVGESEATPISLADAWKEGFLSLPAAVEMHLKRIG